MHKFSVFILTLLTLAGLPCILPAQDKYTDDSRIRYEDHVYKSNIHSVTLHRTDWQFSQPIIELNSGQALVLEFDDFDADYKSYYYTLVHCDADWQPSDANAFDYLKGYTKDFLNDYGYSFNTFQKYTHYRLAIPNGNMQITASGNYLVKIYLDDPDSLILTRRLMVYENQLTIHVSERQPIGRDMYTKQEIKFSVNTSRYPISDPFHALQIFITQNGRWDNAISGVQPQFAQDTVLQYDADYGNIFDGGNEFRSFDITSMRQITEHVAKLIPGSRFEEVELKAEPARTRTPYYTFTDIDGQLLIETKDADSSTTEADYITVHFFLPLDSAFTTGNVYIFGALSDWQCKPTYRMNYDNARGGYSATLFLKQGYYEYDYAFLKDGSKTADVTLLEGNHYETENTYTIFTYYRPLGFFFDKLIGVRSFKAPSN
jgi:hypothetical protein